MPSPKVIDLIVLEKKILRVFTILYNLGIVTEAVYIEFQSPTMNSSSTGLIVSEKKMF